MGFFAPILGLRTNLGSVYKRRVQFMRATMYVTCHIRALFLGGTPPVGVGLCVDISKEGNHAY